MNNRLKQFIRILQEKKLDGFIVTNQTNIFYLTGFKGLSPAEREAVLVIRCHLDRHDALTKSTATLITARLYQNEAKWIAKIHLRGEKSSHLGGGNIRLLVKIVNERNQIFQNVKNIFKNAKRIGFEQHNLSFGEYQEFKKTLSHLGLNPIEGSTLRGLKKLIPTKNLIENLRAVKTPDEIARIEKAQIISQKAFETLVKTLKVGQTEAEIADRLSIIIKSLGGQGLAFETIVASGPNSGKPHHFTDDRRLTINDTLLLDFGTKYQNYCADLSRTIFIGRAHDRFRNIYQHVQTAQKMAIDIIREGLKAAGVHNHVHRHFKKHQLDQYFLHGLGHGIGLEVHENPHLRPASPSSASLGGPLAKTRDPKEPIEELVENMVFSVEPGLYFPDFGVRIEDLVVIKNSKAKVLGNLQKERV